MSGLPVVAVVIPTYNRWPHVREAVESVLAQTYPRIECVVVDDASTDGTAEKLRRHFGGRIRLLRFPANRDKSAARNAGIRATDAEYVCMLDSDDLLLPTAVERRMRLFLEDSRFDGVVYGLSLGERAGPALTLLGPEQIEGDVLSRFVRRPFIDNNGFLLSRRKMLQVGMYREDLSHREDIELIIRLAAQLEFRFCGGPVAQVRRVDDSARTQYQRYLRQGLRMVEHLRRHPIVAARLGNQIELLQRRELMELARACYKSHQYGAFRNLCYLLLRRWPWHALSNVRLTKRFVLSWLLGLGAAPSGAPRAA